MAITISSLLTRALVVLSSLQSVAAFWRMECRASIGTARIDPLASFGAPSEHAHGIYGAKDFSLTASNAVINQSSCTSCIVTQDRSVYWTPPLFFQFSNGSFAAVPDVGGMLAYYLLYGENIQAFPEGFQMIAGDSDRRNFSLPIPDPQKSDWPLNASWVTQDALAQKAVGWNCLNYAETPEGSLQRHSMPSKAYMDANCKDGMRLEMMFPSCWNGKDVDSHNHKDHVAYPDLVMTGTCPTGFDTQLPSLFYETIYNTYAFVGEEGQFVLANGDPTGNGYHGDFMQGWETSFLQDAVNTCTNPSGEVEDCPLFDLQSDAVASSCQMALPTAIANEDVVGPMEILPGNVQIAYGPGPATEPGVGNSPGTSAQTSAVTTTNSAAGYIPATSTLATGGAVGGLFAEVSTPAPTATSAPSETVLSTSIYTVDGQEVHMIIMEEDVTVTITDQAAATSTVAAKARRHKEQVHRHLQRRKDF